MEINGSVVAPLREQWGSGKKNGEFKGCVVSRYVMRAAIFALKKKKTRWEVGKDPFYPEGLVETEKGFGDKNGMVSIVMVISHCTPS
jgi:hypothetical protein